MKISTKIFISTTLAMIISFSIAGSALLSAFFNSGYEQAARTALDSNRMILNSFAGYLRNQNIGDEPPEEQVLLESAEAVTELFSKENIRLQLYQGSDSRIFSNLDFEDDKKVRSQLKQGQTAHLEVEQNGKRYILVVSGMTVGNQPLYLETFQDVTYLYRNREEQLAIYTRVMVVLFVVYSILSFWLAHFIVRPIRSVSRTAARIADGNLEYRIKRSGEDEFGELVYNFNRMADSLAGKIEELKEANRRQEEFVGNFTHELKTPLTSIIGYADLMRSDESISEMNLMCANYIFQEGKRLESLSFRLLELIVLKKQELAPRSVSVIALLKGIQATVMPILIKEQIQITMKAQKGRILAEPELMKTVIMNLIDNARKAITGQGKIILLGRKEADCYVITIQDNGKGIPASQMEKITEAFYMVDKSRSREQGGAGLGLAICAQIVGLHGGSMQFESEEGKGTTVTLRLKLGESME